MSIIKNISAMTVTDKHSVVMNGFRPNGYYVCLVKAFNRVTDKESVVYTESEPFSTVPASEFELVSSSPHVNHFFHVFE